MGINRSCIVDAGKEMTPNAVTKLSNSLKISIQTINGNRQTFLVPSEEASKVVKWLKIHGYPRAHQS